MQKQLWVYNFKPETLRLYFTHWQSGSHATLAFPTLIMFLWPSLIYFHLISEFNFNWHKTLLGFILTFSHTIYFYLFSSFSFSSISLNPHCTLPCTTHRLFSFHVLCVLLLFSTSSIPYFPPMTLFLISLPIPICPITCIHIKIIVLIVFLQKEGVILSKSNNGQ